VQYHGFGLSEMKMQNPLRVYGFILKSIFATDSTAA